MLRAWLRWWLLTGLMVPAAVGWAGTFTVSNSEPDYIAISENGTPVLRYVRGEILAPGAPENRRRSTYVHPLYSLDGVPLTDDFPADHYHQRGLSWMWARVTVDGVTGDLWNLRGIHQRYRSHESRVGSDGAVLTVLNDWFDDASGRRIASEKVRFTTHPAAGQGRIIDFELELAAVDKAVEIGVSARGYGGLNLRFAPRRDTLITTSKGQVADDVDRQRYAWADLSARFGESADYDGVAIFDSRHNLHFPCGWTLRRYGIINPAFTSTSVDYRIEPEQPLALRYRLYVHRGKAEAGALERLFAEYDSTRCSK